MLRNDLEGAIRNFGPDWLLANKEHWTADCYADDMVIAIEKGAHGELPPTAFVSFTAHPTRAANEGAELLMAYLSLFRESNQ